MAFKLIQPNNGIYHIGQCSKKIIWTLHYKYCCNFSWIKMKSIMYAMFFFWEGGTPICRWISSACQWTPFFYTDLTPNDPLFCSGHTQWPPFSTLVLNFAYTIANFRALCMHFEKLTNFVVILTQNLQIICKFCTLNDPPFLGAHTEWPSFFNKILHQMPPLSFSK